VAFEHTRTESITRAKLVMKRKGYKNSLVVEQRERNRENLSSNTGQGGSCEYELLTLILAYNKNEPHYEVERFKHQFLWLLARRSTADLSYEPNL